MLINNKFIIASISPQCSNLGFACTKLGPALVGTVDGRSVDIPMIVQRYKPGKGCGVIGTVDPGTIWIEKGVNEYGLSIANS